MEYIDKYVWYQEGPGVRKNQYTLDGIKLLNVANLVDGQIDLSRSDRYISEEEANNKYKHFLVDEGDLIIASSGIQVDYFDKKMGFAKKEHLPLCMNTSTIRFKSLNAKTTNINYFMWFLKSEIFKKQLRKLITGSAQLNFGPSHLKKIKINMPELKTQNEIVNKLDKVQEIIDIRKKQIEELEELIKSQFVEMFGDPVLNDKNWNKEKMSQLGILERGTSKHRPRNAPELLGGKYPLIQTGDVSNSGLYITEYKSTYSELGLKQSKMWVKNTLCITIAANIAQTSILTFEACFPDSVVGFIANEKVNNIFIHYWFEFLQEIIDAQATQVAQKNINLKILNNLDVIVPPIELQNQFADIVKQIDKQKFEIQKSLEKMQKLQESLMNKYFGE